MASIAENSDCSFPSGQAKCQAPCPPGAFCNTECCDKRTEFWRQRWVCTWQQTPLNCSPDDANANANMDNNMDNNMDEEKDCCPVETMCAYTQTWRCVWEKVDRHTAVMGIKMAQPQKNSMTDCMGCSLGNNARSEACVVPNDQYFAKVWEISYVPCATTSDSTMTPAEMDCACCGVKQQCSSRFVRLGKLSDIPSDLPYEFDYGVGGVKKDSKNDDITLSADHPRRCQEVGVGTRFAKRRQNPYRNATFFYG